MRIPIFPLALASLLPAAHVRGTVITTAADEDNGSLDPSAGGGSGISLREGIRYSGNGATITFAPSLSGQIIRLTLGQLGVTSSQTIDGASLTDRITISGDKTGDGPSSDDVRILSIGSQPVLIDSLVFSGGYAGTNGSGGAIFSNSIQNSPVLTVRNCDFLGNRASSGGAIFMGPPKTTPTTQIVVEHCSFAGNTATANGGGICSESDVSMSNSILNGNTANNGAGIYSTGYSAVLIDRCSLNGNISANSGGGGYINVYDSGINRGTIISNSCISGNIAGAGSTSGAGAGIYVKSITAAISNTTIVNNSAKSSGGGVYNAGNLSITHSTISNNMALLYTSGIMSINFLGQTNLVVENSIVTGNQVENISSYPGTTVTNTLTSGDPQIAPLGDYGGPTRTMPPLPGSPAINAGLLSTADNDQRGLPRDAIPDLGASEYQGNSDLSRFWILDPDGDGLPFGVEMALGTDNFSPDIGSSRIPKAPVFDGNGHAIVSFGLGRNAASGTSWSLWRSADLSPGSFEEIYRFDGSTDNVVPGISFERTEDDVTVTDLEPISGKGFYRFEASLNP